MDKENQGIEEGLVSEAAQDLIKAKVSEKDLLREASGVAMDKAKIAGGVLKGLVTISEEENQILAGANFRDDEEADRVAAALAEAKRYGCGSQMILRWVSAHCGVGDQRRSKTEWGIQGLTHLEINNPKGGHGFNFRNKKDEEGKGE